MTTTDPTATAPQPAPLDLDLARHRDILRTAADNLDALPGQDFERRVVAADLRRWADELDAAPATYSLPPEPPESGTELWDCGGCRWERDVAPGHWRWVAAGRTQPGHWHPDHPEPLIVPWAALLGRHGPLSSVPPAGTPEGGEH